MLAMLGAMGAAGGVADDTDVKAGGSSKAAGKAVLSLKPAAAANATPVLPAALTGEAAAEPAVASGAAAAAAVAVAPKAGASANEGVAPKAGGSSNVVSNATVAPPEKSSAGMGGAAGAAAAVGVPDCFMLAMAMGEPAPERADAMGVMGLLPGREPGGAAATKGAPAEGLMGLGAPSPGSALTST